MLNRFRNLFESIVYAGMKPGRRSAEGAPGAKPRLFARILNGPANPDPLYLTNQAFGQTALRVLMVAAAMLLVIAGGLVSMRMLAPKTAAVPRALTADEIAPTRAAGLTS